MANGLVPPSSYATCDFHSRTNRRSDQMASKIFSSFKNKLGKGKAPEHPAIPAFHNALYGESVSTLGIDQPGSLSFNVVTNSSPRLGLRSASSHNGDDQPPPYSFRETERPRAAPGPSPESSNAEFDEDQYALLSLYDTVLLVDDSSSMGGSRWDETREALATVAEICTQYDPDGVDIYFMNRNDETRFHNVKTAAAVMNIFTTQRDIYGRLIKFEPRGQTPTGPKLRGILEDYLHRFEQNRNIKGLNVICITDGAASPNKEPDLPLIDCAIKLQELKAPVSQLGVQFLQVGNDKAAAQQLQHLDNNLLETARQYGYSIQSLRDIVDTVPFKGDQGAKLTGEGILKVVMGAICKRFDWNESDGTHA